MSSEQVEKALAGSNGFVSFVKPVIENGSLSAKLTDLIDKLHIHVALDSAREEARVAYAKHLERNSFIPHTGGFL